MPPLNQAADAPPAGAAAAWPFRRAVGATVRNTAEPDGLHAEPGPAAGTVSTADAPAVGPVAVLLLANVAPASRLWGWSRIVRGSRPLRAEPGLRWARVMGSGQGGGFGLRPSVSHQGVFAVFDSLAAAQAFVSQSEPVAAYRARSSECLTALLQPWSVRGSWGGQHLDLPSGSPSKLGNLAEPVLALTRASIRPLKAARFWAMAPAAQASLGSFPGCRLAAGLGEAPLLRQCTVSLWDSVQAMDAYARSGAHLAAIRAAADHGFFSESMFARFRVLAIAGQWQGRSVGAVHA